MHSLCAQQQSYAFFIQNSDKMGSEGNHKKRVDTMLDIILIIIACGAMPVLGLQSIFCGGIYGALVGIILIVGSIAGASHLPSQYAILELTVPLITMAVWAAYTVSASSKKRPYVRSANEYSPNLPERFLNF